MPKELINVEAGVHFVEESTKLCRQLVTFWKMRQSFEYEYAKNMGFIFLIVS
jgi:hypothetical protein